MPKKKLKPTNQPLKVRPGAAYTCFGDGFCCSDLHGLGPLDDDEVEYLVRISPDVVHEDDDEEQMLCVRHDGKCLFLGEGRCELHAALGKESKPEGCKRFPLGLTATPTGGRITTRHRCTCRTLGERPPVTPEDSRESLLDPEGELESDRDIENRIYLSEERSITFADWEAREVKILQQLNDPRSVPETFLDAKPFPPLEDLQWEEEANNMLSEGADTTRFGVCLEWFAKSILELHLKKPQDYPDFPWASDMDVAEARAQNHERDPEAMFKDWLADEIWSLQWAEDEGSFHRARLDLMTRLTIARHIQNQRQATTARKDRATAEALAVVDLIAESEWWEDIVAAMPQ